MPNSLPEVVWSRHAVERGEERFGDCTQLTFPDELIQAVGSCKQVSETFKVGQGGVIYVCVRADEDIILVKTIHESGTISGETLPHNRKLRRKMSKRDRESRSHYKQACKRFCLGIEE